MKSPTLLLALAAAAALGACKSQSTAGPANEAAGDATGQANTAAPIEMPPAIVATHTYRCKDNGLVYVDWLQDGRGANVRTELTSPSTPLKPGADGQPPFTAEGGYSLTGSQENTSITLAMAGKPAQTCRRG